MKRITVTVRFTLKQAQDLATDYHNNADICAEPSGSNAWRQVARKVEKAIGAAMAERKSK